MMVPRHEGDLYMSKEDESTMPGLGKIKKEN